jgi:ABC-type Fe3+ transport system permease subunit
MKMRISPAEVLKFVGVVLWTALSGLIVAVMVGFLLAWILWRRLDFAGLVGLATAIVVAYPLGVLMGQIVVKGF